MENINYRKSHSQSGYGRIYSKTYREGYYHYQWLLLEKPFLSKRFKSFKEEKIIQKYLDFACGTGRITSLAELYFNPVYGVDVSASMLEVAKENCKNTLLIQRDITQDSLGEKFDIVTAFRFFVNAEYSLKKSALQAIHNHLNPKGFLICNIHQNKNSLLGLVMRAINFFKKKPIYSTMSHKEFCCLLQAHGFIIDETFWYSFFPWTGRYFPWMARWFLRPVDRVIDKIPFFPKKWAQSFIVVARRR